MGQWITIGKTYYGNNKGPIVLGVFRSTVLFAKHSETYKAFIFLVMVMRVYINIVI